MTTASRRMEEESKHGKLPPGFRFHPTDEELITHYLKKKTSDHSFTGRAIADVDLNRSEPWELPGKAKMGEKEWYFFSMRDRKYPTGVRTNRATNTGYWKTTGKDKEIFSSGMPELVGMKKTLVFYKGRAPRGEKTNWVIHEYRIHSARPGFKNTSKDEWVVCRVFQKKSSGGKTPHKCPPRVSNNSGSPYNEDLFASARGVPSSSTATFRRQNGPSYHLGVAGGEVGATADLAELASVLRGGGGGGNHHSGAAATIFPVPAHVQQQQQIRFALSGPDPRVGVQRPLPAALPFAVQPQFPVHGPPPPQAPATTGVGGAAALCGPSFANGGRETSTNQIHGGHHGSYQAMERGVELDSFWPDF